MTETLPDKASPSSQDRGYRELLQSTAMITAPTFISRILGYVRDMLQAFFMGTGSGADAFTIAFVIPNLLRSLTAEGSMTAAFIPTFTRVKKQGSAERTQDFTNAMFFSLAVVVAGLTLLGILTAPLLVKAIASGYQLVPGKMDLTVSLLRIMFPYILFLSLAALCSAILNSHFKFGLAAASSIFFNLAMIATIFLLVRKTEDPAYPPSSPGLPGRGGPEGGPAHAAGYFRTGYLPDQPGIEPHTGLVAGRRQRISAVLRNPGGGILPGALRHCGRQSSASNALAPGRG